MAISNGEIQERAFKLSKHFKPASPINREDLFAGRTSQTRDVVDTINQTGQHAVLYGERGVGKTSLANVIFPKLKCENSEVIAPLVNCMTQDTYTDIWKRVFGEIDFISRERGIGLPKSTKKIIGDYTGLYSDSISPDVVRMMLIELGKEMLVVIILDEFDAITDEGTRSMMSDTIKYLSDRFVPATLVLVGVADDVDGLIENHRSIERCLRQIKMPRMSRSELEEIVVNGLTAVDMNIDESALYEISRLSIGLPHYAHLLGLHSGRCALDNRSEEVTKEDVGLAVQNAINTAQASIQSDYLKAITSSRTEALYKQVLLACAMVKTDDLGWFYAGDVREPLGRILKKPSKIESFARHLHAFCERERGPVLDKDDRPKRTRYRFVNPLLQPYVMIRGMAEKLILEQDLHETRDKSDPQRRLF